MTDPIETIRTLVDDVNAARAELAKALGPSERSLASGVALLREKLAEALPDVPVAANALHDAYCAAVAGDDVFARGLTTYDAGLRAVYRLGVAAMVRAMRNRIADVSYDKTRRALAACISESISKLSEAESVDEAATLRAEVERLEAELAEARASLDHHVKLAEEEIRATNAARAELDAIKAPRCLTDEEIVNVGETCPESDEWRAVARAAERKLVVALLGILAGRKEAFVADSINASPWAQTQADEAFARGLRAALTAIGAPAAEPAQPEPAASAVLSDGELGQAYVGAVAAGSFAGWRREGLRAVANAAVAAYRARLASDVNGRWQASSDADPDAVIAYAEEPSPETGHEGWIWWARGGHMGESKTYEDARKAAVEALEKGR